MPKQLVIPEKVLLQNPLFWPGQGPVVVKSNQLNIFIGTGITTPTQLSKGLPFDALGFLLSAEFIKRQIPKTFTKIIKSLRLANWHILLASKLFPRALPATYETLETRDVNHFIKHHQVGLKVGWKFGAGTKYLYRSIGQSPIASTLPKRT